MCSTVRWLTADPGAPTTQWYQLRCVFSQPMYVMAGRDYWNSSYGCSKCTELHRILFKVVSRELWEIHLLSYFGKVLPVDISTQRRYLLFCEHYNLT
ncbi:hypothetical protein MKX03_033429, partial [Papaver bracteatum]